MRVELCGVRGSTPAPGAAFARYGGHTSCLALTRDGADRPELILDAGTGIRSASSLLDGRAFSGTILLTHLHWDHIQGLPFFAAGDHDDSELTVVIPEQEDERDALSVLSRTMSPPFFPIGPDELRGSWSFHSLAPGESIHAGFEILALEIPHKGGRTFGYRVSDGRTTLTYMPDHCPTSLGPGPDGYGEYHAAALELAGASDLLVHDAQLLVEELPADSRFGHSCGEYAVELARRAAARAVLLFHHRPDRSDAELDRLAGRFAAAKPAVTLAAQDATIVL
jgi:phosphoribosyl 1,2-cyclic phosphodiesterase